MMSTEEGSGLMTKETPESIVNSCIDNADIRRIRWITFGLAIGNAADAVEILCVGYIMTELGDSITSADKEFLSAAVFMGMLFGGMLTGYISDRFGRKFALLLALGLNFLAGVASAFAPSVDFLIVCRVLGGIGIGGSVPAVFTLGAEVTPSPIRGQMLSYIACFWMTGSLFVALVAWIMLGNDFNHKRILAGVSWRWFAGVCAIPAFTAFVITLRTIPESPRFLLLKGRVQEAADILTSLSGVTVRVDQLVHSSGDYKFNAGESGEQGSVKETMRVLFGPKLARSTLTLLLIWFSLAFGSYGISTWISTLFSDIGLSNPYEDAFIFAIAQLPGNVVSIYFIETIGRKRLLVWGLIVSALSGIGFGLGTAYPGLVVTAAAVFSAASVTSWNSLDVMSVEDFPTPVRASAMGCLSAAGRIGAVSAQFVNGSLEQNIPLLLFVTSACMLTGGLGAYSLPVELAGASMPETGTEDLSVNQGQGKYKTISITENVLSQSIVHNDSLE